MSESHRVSSEPAGRRAGLTLAWLGHATVLIEMDGARLLTDPVLRRRVGPLLRLVAAPAPEALGRLDAVLLSHLHADHTDLPTIRRLDFSGPLLVPHHARAWLAGRGIRDVCELAPGHEATVAGVRITATRAEHDPRRRPLGPAATPVGFLISGSSSVYFAGDTDLFPEMVDLRGRVDVALLPVSGWGPTVGAGHLDPERAAAAVMMIEPAIAVPIHWGTLALAGRASVRGDPARPARDFAAYARRLAPKVEVRVLACGERMVL